MNAVKTYRIFEITGMNCLLDGLVLKGTCIVIPESCRDEILDQLHEGHFGIDRTKLHARDSVYWPCINQDIECLVKTCDLCQEHSHRNNKDPTIPRDIPIQAWSTVQIDLFTLDSQSFLLVVDVTSRFPVVRILKNEMTTSVINALQGIYCDFGLPRKIISDNGPCFRSEDFKEFHGKLGVSTDTISSYNHASLGSAEHMVQTVKQIMVKNPQNAWLAMLIFKATMIPEIQKSPSELLNSHKYRTNLPMIDFSQSRNDEPAEKLIHKCELKAQKESGKELPKLDVGTPVLYDKNPDSTKVKRPKWCKGTIKNRQNPCKYEILTDDSDRVIMRSRRHVKVYLTMSGRVSKAPKHLIEN